MNKVHKAETERAAAVLRSSVELSELLCLIPPGPTDGDVLAALPPDAAACLADLAARERRHGEAVASRAVSSREEDLLASAAAVRRSTRQTLRALKASSEATSVLRRVVEPSVTLQSFASWFGELETAAKARMSLTVEQEAERSDVHFTLSQQIANAEHSIRLLEDELRRERLARETDVTALADTEKNLRAELEDLTTRAERDRKALLTTTAEREDAALTAHTSRREMLEAKLAAAEQEHEKMAEDMRATEQALRKRRNLLELDVAQKVKEYDTEMMDKQQKIDEIRASHEKELVRLERLQEHFEMVDRNEALAAEEAKTEAERLAQLEKTYHMCYGPPARTIQRAWLKRQQLKAEAAAKKKGGKKGKKKGKKGGRR